MIRVFLTLALLALAVPAHAATQALSCQDANGSTWPVSPQHPCAVDASAGGVAPGTSGATAQPVQGVTGGVPVTATISNVLVPPIPMFISPTTSSAAGITPTVSSSGPVSGLVIRNTIPANLYSAHITNVTATAGVAILYNNTAIPATGALNAARIWRCVPLPANGQAIIEPHIAPYAMTTGAVIIISSALDCATYTTGTVTAFISAQAQ